MLAGESDAATATEVQQYNYPADSTISAARPLQSSTFSTSHNADQSIATEDTETVYGYGRPRAVQHGSSDSVRREAIDNVSAEQPVQTPAQRIPLHDQRTVLISNLPERSTHKDLTGIIRGGRLLDIFLRSDRTATVSFVEGAADFLAYAKRTDVYLHMKRVSLGC